MINVLSIVSYPFLPAKMGGQKGIALFYQYLCRLIPVTCVTTVNNDAGLADYEVRKLLSDSKLRYINPFYFLSIRRIIKEKEISHVILEHPYYGWLGIALKTFCGVRLVIHSHNIEAERFKSLGKWWWGILWHYEKWTHRKSDINFFIQDADREYAISRFGLDPEKCVTITYGIPLSEAPARDKRKEARESLNATYGLSGEETLLLFNGTLDYQPNLDAVEKIITGISPSLQQEKGFAYRIFICGKNLPAALQDKIKKDKYIIYTGFVEDIDLYFLGTDIFINPVIEGGGIKTKVVEALGNGLAVISTESGAIGIPAEITGGKLAILKDGDWASFSRQVMQVNTARSIPDAYFKHFYWGNIAGKAANTLNGIFKK